MFPTNINVLVAEDSITIREILKMQLSKMGYQNVVESIDGLQALETLQKNQSEGKAIHLIIADWHMPNMSGLDLLVHVKSDPQFETIPFLMVTGDQELSLVALAISNGADDFIVKPVTSDVLHERMSAIWQRVNKPAE
jgi:two-component system chemotaxis response regulator CheY